MRCCSAHSLPQIKDTRRPRVGRPSNTNGVLNCQRDCVCRSANGCVYVLVCERERTRHMSAHNRHRHQQTGTVSRANARALSLTHVRTHAHSYVHTQTCTQICTYATMYTSTHAHTYTPHLPPDPDRDRSHRTYLCPKGRDVQHTYIYTFTHMHVYMCICSTKLR